MLGGKEERPYKNPLEEGEADGMRNRDAEEQEK